MENLIHHKPVLITGGSRGIGRATADICLQKGHSIIITARNQADLDTAVNEWKEQGIESAKIQSVLADMNKPEVVKSLPSKIDLPEEGLFGLVSNASYQVLKDAVDFSEQELQQTMQVNILSPILLIQFFYPYLKKAKGNIVHVGSISDTKRDRHYSLYGGSKAFMTAFVGHAAQEMGFDGVRINVVSPGATDTPLIRRMTSDGNWDLEELQKFKQSIPIEQRYGYAEEIAEAIYFTLAGPRYFHGEDLRIYGGHK